MHDELTKVDIELMKKELSERRLLAAELREEVGRTRAYGDLSENDEYRCAKREFNKNNSRIRYLENMIKTAVIISTDSDADRIGLFDKVEIYYPEDDEKRTVRIVTTLRNDVLSDNISKESPFGKALLGHKAGETITIHVNEKVSYPVKILSITKGQDDPNIPISSH